MDINKLTTAIVALFFQILAYLYPLGNEIFILAMVFVANFFTGMSTDLVVNDSSFSFKKAWRCIKELTTFFALVCFVYTFGEKKGSPEGAVQCVSFITYVVTWFYSQNILRNIRALFRKETAAYRIIDFFYYIVSVEFVKNIKFLSTWIEVAEHQQEHKEG